MIDFWFMVLAITTTAAQNFICWYFWFYMRFKRIKETSSSAFVSVLVPCRGLDPGFRDNLMALMRQEHPNYEVIFAVRTKDDPAYPVLEEVRRTSKRPVKVVIPSRMRAVSDKLNNLLAAIEAADERSTIFTVMDSDVSPRPDWLGKLVAPLSNPKIGISSGYRFYLPPSFDFVSYLRSVWSASLALYMPLKRLTSCYGGAMAFKRDFFEHYRIAELWERAVADDVPISNRAIEAGYYVLFVPDCLVPSYEHSDWRSFISWANRQCFIIKTYASKRWMIGLVMFFSWYFLSAWGTAKFFWELFANHTFNLYAFLTMCLIAVIPLNGYLMASGMEPRLFNAHIEPRYRKVLHAYPFFALIGQLLSPIQLISATFKRHMRWRNFVYKINGPYDIELVSPSETVCSHSALGISSRGSTPQPADKTK